MVKVAINGFGRIGRQIFKLALDKGINVVAINDLSDINNLAYLLKYDSVYGKYDKKIEVKNGYLVVGRNKVKVLNEKDPEKLPWKSLGVDYVVESTGFFTDKINASKHLTAGAKKVLITAPSKDSDVTIVLGVNDSDLNRAHKIISVASCTTNALSPIVKVLEDNFGVEKGFMNTVHAYTASQKMVDGTDKKFRRGRSGGINIIPTTSGATKATSEVIPKLKGKIDGLALRVPVITGSIVDFTCLLKKEATREEINHCLKKASNGPMKGVLEYSEDELVSTDIIKNSHSSIVDGLSTQSLGKLVKVLAWYDNEFGYSNRVVDVLKKLR